MNCPKCNKPNRPVAKYCKWCAHPIAVQTASGADPLDNLVDKDKMRDDLREIVEKAKSKAEYCRRNNISARMQLSFVITGDAGTGKTEVAKTIAAALAAAGVTGNPVPETVNPVDYDNWLKDIDKHASRLGNSVLIIEEAQKLVSTGESEEVVRLDNIIQATKRWRDDPSKPVVIITGNERLRKFFHETPNSAAAFNYFFETGEITLDGLLSIALLQLRDKYHRTLDSEAKEKLRRVFINDIRNPDDATGASGHDAATRAYQIDLAAVGTADTVLGPQFVTGKEFKPKTYQEIMAELNRYVGVEEVKKELRTIANSIAEDVRAGQPAKVMHHYLFLGNPGTGKTTMARIFANALNALGALPVGHFKEVCKDDLVSQYVAETTSKVVDVFHQAMGGVLFIDEAYQLANDSHGKDAVETLLKLASDNKGKIVVIMAGYTKEMGEFVRNVNSGIESRFDRTINFRDYTPEELTEIFRRLVSTDSRNLILAPDADAQIVNFFRRMYMTRTRTFGNAREVNTAFIRAVENMKNRLAENPASGYGLTMKDIEGMDGENKKTVDEILAELDDLVGMEDVKNQLRNIANTFEFNRRRMLTGLAKAKVGNYHIAITGNPGTGKTEIAKRLGRILKAIGVLSKGHVVERERKTLLDSYSNSAGVNMEKAVDEAMGGVLFIDEAYNLVPMDNPTDKDRDGTAAVEALMTRMANDAGKFVTVIAGYKDQIEEFIANANPGLKRRFTHRIHIEDYTVPQLVEIYMRRAKADNFKLTPEAEEILERKVQEMVTMKDKNFGNAGEMIKLFDATLERQSQRLSASMDSVSDEDLFIIKASDIPYEAPRKVDIKQCMKELDELVGLHSVKKIVHDLADAIEMEQQRAALEGRRPNVPMNHYLFLGNPGTGKTTVARIMGNIFYSLGLLPSNKLVEVKPGDMIAGFVGHTAPKTRQIIDRGLGGVLFIDEAYGLNDGHYGTTDASPELLTRLNDYEGRMVCIAAGYPREMSQWLSTNTGLDRRFQVKITFEDYTAEELLVIFKNIIKKEGMKAEEYAIEEARRYFEYLVSTKGDSFGNAAEAVKLFKAAKINQGARLRKMGDFDRQELYIIRKEDIRPL